MAGYALRVVKGTRRRARCGRCHADITWATLAQRHTRSIPLVVSPVLLREERTDTDVSVEVFGFDQVHRCPVRKDPAPARRASARPSAAPAPMRPSDTAYASFTPDRIQYLKAQIAPTPKPPQPSRL
jgi:hypothetical protein